MKTLSFQDIQHFLYRGELQLALQEVQNYLFLVSPQFHAGSHMRSVYRETQGILRWLNQFSALHKHHRKIDTLGISVVLGRIPKLYAFAYQHTEYSKYNEDWLKDFDYCYDTPYLLPTQMGIRCRKYETAMGSYAQPEQLLEALSFLHLCELLVQLHLDSIREHQRLGTVNFVILGDTPPFTFFSACPRYLNAKLSLCS